MRFTDLARATKAGTLDLGGGDAIHFRFRHGLITPRYLHTLLALDESRMAQASAGEQEAAITSICEQVCKLVAEWDLQDADGSMFPLDVERLAADIPVAVQIALLQQCLVEMQATGQAAGEAAAPEAGSASKPASGAISSPTARSARRPRGTRS